MSRFAALLSLVAFVLVVSSAQAENWALDFDGADDYAISRDYSIGYAELTVEAWVHPRPAYRAQIVGVPMEVGDEPYFQLEREGDHLLFDAAGSYCRVESGYALPDHEWSHVAAVWQPPGIVIYVNGDPVAQGGCDAGYMDAAENYLIIGKEIIEGFQTQWWDGAIDELRIWTVARTQDQIIANMYLELGGEEPGLHSYWKFNEGEGQHIHDSTAAARIGSLGASYEAEASDPSWVFIDSPVPVGSVTWSHVKAMYR